MRPTTAPVTSCSSKMAFCLPANATPKVTKSLRVRIRMPMRIRILVLYWISFKLHGRLCLTPLVSRLSPLASRLSTPLSLHLPATLETHNATPPAPRHPRDSHIATLATRTSPSSRLAHRHPRDSHIAPCVLVCSCPAFAYQHASASFSVAAVLPSSSGGGSSSSLRYAIHSFPANSPRQRHLCHHLCHPHPRLLAVLLIKSCTPRHSL